jgi:hypothetical protein
MKNYTGSEVRIIDKSTMEEIAFICSEKNKIHAIKKQIDLNPIGNIPVVEHSIKEGYIEGLEEIYGDIIVSLEVAEVMRYMGYVHSGKVYTPGPTVFSPGLYLSLGSYGLVYHSDISTDNDNQ